MSNSVDVEDSERKNELEEEMSRFEQEIAGHPISRPIISANTFKLASQAIQEAVHVPPMHTQPLPRPPRPPHMPQGAPLFPRNVQQHHMPMPPPPMMPSLPMPNPHAAGPMPPMMHHQMPHGMPPPGMQTGHPMPMQQVLPAMPQGGMPVGPMQVQCSMVGPAIPGPAAPVITPAEQREWESTYTVQEEGKKKKKIMRVAGSQVWEDSTLASWDPNDFRIFCGDLGVEVTDESLTRAFSKYASFLKAKIVRDKKSQKSRGYGFVSFKDPNDFIKAMREMNGKYIGSRPIKLRKSTWKDRNVDVVKKKAREKKKLGLR